MKPLFKFRPLLWLAASMACLSTSIAQPVWTKDFQTPVNWQKVTYMGQLVASTGKGLIGINTATGEQMWILPELKNSPENSYRSIDQSPFITLSDADGGRNLYMVDPLNGKIIFSSRASGLDEVTDQFFFYESAKLLVIGTAKGASRTEMVMTDMTTGGKLWSKSGAYSFITGAREVGNNEVLVTSAFFASKLNMLTGEEIWKSPIDPRTAGLSSVLEMLEGFASKKLTKEEVMAQLITTPDQPGMFIIAAQKKNESTKVDSKGAKTVSITYSSVYMAFETATGKHKWEQVVEMKFPLGVSYPSAKGLIVCSASDGNINMLNYSDGSKMLGKRGGGLGLKGSAAGVAPMSDGKLLMVSGGNNSFITILDPQTGLLTFDKAVKIKGSVTYTELLPNGVLVGTTSEVNFLNTATGEWFMEDAMEGGAGLIASNETGVYVFNLKDNLLYSMEPGSTSFKPFSSAPVLFQGKEKPKAIEILPNGILITSDQNLALFDNKGALLYNQYYPAPAVSGFRKALLIASAVRAIYYSAAYTAYSAAFGAASQSIQVKDASSRATKEVTADISKAFGGAAVTGAGYAATYFKMASQRFKATMQTQDYMLVMTAESKKDSRLLVVSKADGKIRNSVQLGKDKDPVYDVDLVEGRLYYMKEGSKMECHTF